MRKRLSRAAVVATVVALTAVACSNSTTTTPAGSSGGGTAPAFDLKIGDIVSLTGDLSAYGPAIDKGAHVAVQVINDALAQDGITGITVEIVGTEDDQTDAKAGVEAATKLVQTNKVDMIMGPLGSTVTEGVAQSVTVPNQIVTISPSASASTITNVNDQGYLYRTAPADSAQAHFLVQ